MGAGEALELGQSDGVDTIDSNMAEHGELDIGFARHEARRTKFEAVDINVAIGLALFGIEPTSDLTPFVEAE